MEALPAPDFRGPAATRVLIVDDHDFFRRGLREMLCAYGVGPERDAASGEDALESARSFHPEVVLMDLNLPGMPGTEATRRLLAMAPGTRVVALTISEDERDVMEAVAAGARGYLVKSASIEELAAGIEAVAAGNALLSPSVASLVLDHVRDRRDRVAGEEAIRHALSERELEVLRLLAAGRENSEIAAALFISSGTVKNHIASILAKLGVENRVQAAVWAARAGLV